MFQHMGASPHTQSKRQVMSATFQCVGRREPQLDEEVGWGAGHGGNWGVSRLVIFFPGNQRYIKQVWLAFLLPRWPSSKHTTLYGLGVL